MHSLLKKQPLACSLSHATSTVFYTFFVCYLLLCMESYKAERILTWMILEFAGTVSLISTFVRRNHLPKSCL